VGTKLAMVTRIPTRMAMAFTTATTTTRMMMRMMKMISTATTVATRIMMLTHDNNGDDTKEMVTRMAMVMTVTVYQTYGDNDKEHKNIK
jgi:hypothetical protein